MSLTFTYSELVAAMQDWAEDDNSDYVAEIPAMISRAEMRVLKDLDLEMWEQDQAVTISGGNRDVAKPTDAVYIQTVFVRDPSSLQWYEVVKRSSEFCQMYAPIESETGRPEYFAEDDEETFIVVPTPDQTYSSSNAKVRCTIRPTGLSASNTTTWLSTHQADLLFHACMIEAYVYLKHPAKMQEAAQLYQSLLPSISKEIEDTVRRRYRALNSQTGADS